MALSTPLYDLRHFLNVYEPSEDTFLLLDCLESDMNSIISLTPEFIVEIGSGSGVIITALASVLGNKAAFFATDINYEACLATLHTGKLNSINIESCSMNLLYNFKKGIFDLVLLNPPYVVTDSDEIEGNGLSRAWAGGHNGREVIDKVLTELPVILSAKGVCYMVVIEDNKPSEIECEMRKLGFKTVILNERKVRGEHLLVLKIYR